MTNDPLPLTGRLDALARTAASESAVSAWGLRTANHGLYELELPIYSRVIHDGVLGDGLAEALSREFQNFGVPWLDSDIPMANEFSGRIASIPIDGPVDMESVNHAVAVQLQMYGVPFQSVPASKWMHWKPALPVELYSLEQLAQKVEAIRVGTMGKLPIGAALIANPKTIYEDVRYLLDCNVDWIEIVQSVHHDLYVSTRLAFCETDAAVQLAIKARIDSKKACQIWLTSDLATPAQWMIWLNQGIDGVCIDSYLSARRPAITVSKDSFAGIRVTTTTAGAHEWVGELLRDVRVQLIDQLKFHDRM